MEPEQFEELVAEAVKGLPGWVHDALDNVELFVEAEPPPGQHTLLGLYQGIPLTKRGNHYAGVLPDRITLYRSTLERSSGGNREQLRQLVCHTVEHELAHHFGISDDRLREIGKY
jgi:predicted Zn-dependent protease with MMP-like domain